MKCLVLNLDYNPLCVVSYKRAIVLMMNNQNMTVLSYYDSEIKSENSSHRVPSVMLYQCFVAVKHSRSPAKKRILSRDLYTCQYCSSKISGSSITVDHIVPSSRFENKKDSNTWQNLVACCRDCNRSKGNRTPKEAGMSLTRQPKESKVVCFNGTVPDEWRDFLWRA